MRKYVVGTEAAFQQGALLLGEPELLPPAPAAATIAATAIAQTRTVRRGRSALVIGDLHLPPCTFPSRLLFVLITLFFAVLREQRGELDRASPTLAGVDVPRGAATWGEAKPCTQILSLHAAGLSYVGRRSAELAL